MIIYVENLKDCKNIKPVVLINSVKLQNKKKSKG